MHNMPCTDLPPCDSCRLRAISACKGRNWFLSKNWSCSTADAHGNTLMQTSLLPAFLVNDKEKHEKNINNCWQDSLGRAWIALLPITPGKQHPEWLHVLPMIIPGIWAIWISHQRCLLDGTPMDVLCNFPCGHSFACDGVKGRQDEARINRES